MADYNKLLQVPRGTKARLKQIKLNLLVNTIVYATDTKELGIKLSNGNIEYFMNATDINARLDPNAMTYFNYAGSVYGDKYSLLPNAWEHSLIVVPLEISETSDPFSPRGKAQYPNGEVEGVIIPQGVTSIGSAAFGGWTSNNQPLVIPNSVTSIGDLAFSYWTSNNQPLVIPNSVTSIGNLAFSDWQSNNQPLVIPDSVTSIGNYAFMDWQSVPYVEIQATTPPTLAYSNAFDNQNDAPIYVPNSSVEAYKTVTKWEDLADRIFPISDMTGDSVLSDRIDNLEISKQDKLVAGDNITIDENTNVISASREALTVDLSNYFNKTETNSMLDDKVDKVTSKGLSTNDYTTTEKNKLAGIASGAEVNVQSDWNATSGDALILNKPTIPTNNNQLTNGAGYITGYTETDPIFTAWNKSTGISITKSQVSDLLEATQALSGLMSATDKTRLDVLHALLEEDTANNVVDSINEVLAIFNNYPEGADLVTALAGKVDKVEGMGLSENDLTNTLKSNYDTAYTHSQSAHAPSNAEQNVQSNWTQTLNTADDFIKNKPSLSTVATSGSYNDLSNKPAIPDTSGLLPKSGGTLENYNEKITTLSTSSGAINLSLSSVFVQTPSANISYSITNAVSGVAHSFTLIVNMGAAVRTLTFPASVKWQGGTIPDLTTASKTYVLTFLTVNGGTTWLGMFGGEF